MYKYLYILLFYLDKNNDINIYALYNIFILILLLTIKKIMCYKDEARDNFEAFFLKRTRNRKRLNEKKLVNEKLWCLINTVLVEYVKSNKKYPLNVDELISIENDFSKIIEEFKDKYNEEIDIIIHEIFFNEFQDYFNEYSKENKKYLTYNYLEEKYKNTIKEFWLNKDDYDKLVLKYIIKEINKTNKNNKMKTYFKEVYNKNKELFNTFIMMNLNEDKDEKIEAVGQKMKKIIEELEDQVLSTLESSQHSDKSVSTSEKYRSFIKSIFPMYWNVWVKVKKLSKQEMAEYIKKMHKKK